MKKLKVFIITGEKSGCDILKKVLLNLKSEFELDLVGICNNELEASFQVKKIFDLKEISFMGIVDVLLNLRSILKRIDQTVEAIFEEKPDLIISVDSFDFCYRVAKKFRDKFDKINSKNFNKLNQNENFQLPKLVHLVAPSVWLYKKDRAKKLAKFYHLLLTIIPDEEKFFIKYNLPTFFIGNPALYKDEIDLEEKNLFISKMVELNNKNSLKKDVKIISITIGSRVQEIKKHIDIIIKTIMNLNKYCANKDFDFAFKILSTNDTKELINSYFQRLDKENLKTIDIICDEKYKDLIIKNSDFAIAKSGTNTFDFIFHKIPFLVYYKTSWINIFVAIFFFRIKFANLLNIIANKGLIPEFLQHKANAENITNFVIKYFEEKERKNFEEYNNYIEKFKSPNSSNPFQLACHYIKHLVANSESKQK